jgi:hypothetical protein
MRWRQKRCEHLCGEDSVGFLVQKKPARNREGSDYDKSAQPLLYFDSKTLGGVRGVE